MELTLRRKFKGAAYTIGDLSIGGEFFCNTIEDTVRDLPATCPDTSRGRSCTCGEKVYAKTAIPAGTYKITLEYTVTSTVRSVGATRRATSSALSRSGELPMMPKRCFTVVISVIYSGCSGWDAADGSSAACGSSMYSFSACFSRASRQSPKAMAATASRAAITAIQMNRSARRRGTRST